MVFARGTDTGHLNGTFLDPALIKRVEIVRGPSALLYGSGALGGVISYDTVDAKDLLQEGQSSGFRVFGTGGTGDHSTGLGASAFGRTENLDGIVAGPVAIGVIYARAMVKPRRMTSPLITCWRKGPGKLIQPSL